MCSPLLTGSWSGIHERSRVKLQQDVRDRGLEHVYFAWAGDTKRGTPHYFRIHTERFLMEFVNAVASGDHIHSVLRDFKNDLGGDIIIANHPNPFPTTLPAGMGIGHPEESPVRTWIPGSTGALSAVRP